jgi:hypothetical protein
MRETQPVPLCEEDWRTLTIDEEDKCATLSAVVRSGHVAFAMERMLLALKCELIHLSFDRLGVDLANDVERGCRSRGREIRRGRAGLQPCNATLAATS